MTMEQEFYDAYKAWVNTHKFVTVGPEDWRGIKQENWDIRTKAWAKYCVARDSLHGFNVKEVVFN